MLLPVRSQLPARRRPHLLLLLWLAVAALLPGRAHAQSPGPAGGTLTPATSSECPGFNSGTLTLNGFSGTIIKYQFDNGNGFADIAGSGGQPTYTYSNLFQTTRYRAVVQNGTAAAVTSTVATVTVDPAPTATINSAGPTRFCQRGTIYLIAGPTGPYTYQFMLNGRDIAGATSQTYTATVTNGGSYSVRVTNASGCSSTSAAVIIQVQGQNVVSLAAAGPTDVCQGTPVPLTATIMGQGASGYTYQYSRNGVEIPGATSPTYSATTSGNYTVVVYNPSTCSATSNTVAVTVTPVPVVSFRYDAASYCVSGPTAPTPAVSPAGGAFTSTTGLSLNAATGAIALAQSQPGTYAITYTTSGTCPATSNANVTITAAPTADFGYAAGTRCAGTAGTLAPALAAGATAGSFAASPAGLSLNAATGAVNLAQSQPGTYTVTNTVAAANGCAATSAPAQLVLTAQPVAALAAGGATTFCDGGSVTLTAGGGEAGATYQFLSGGQAIAGATGPTYAAAASGSYAVLITNPGGCASTSAPLAVTVNPVPAQPTLSATVNLLTASGAGAGATYQFYLNGAAIAGATGPTYAATQGGTYTVVVTSAAGCASPASAPLTLVLTASRAAQAAFELTAYPNPTFDGRLTVAVAGAHAAARLALFNALGQQVLSGTLAAAAASQELDLSGLAAGVYTLRATTPTGTVTQRVVRQ